MSDLESNIQRTQSSIAEIKLRIAQRKSEYLTLLKPDRRLILAGDYTTYLSGWMAGALESARAAVTSVHERAMTQTTSARRGQ